jgi:hypothetical protein
MHVTEIRDFGDAPILVGGRVLDGRKDGCHRHVDPGVDGTPLLFDRCGGALDGSGVRNIRRDGERLTSCLSNLARTRVERFGVTGEQADARAACAVRPCHRAPDAAGRAGNDDDFSGHTASNTTRHRRRAASRLFGLHVSDQIVNQLR